MQKDAWIFMSGTRAARHWFRRLAPCSTKRSVSRPRFEPEDIFQKFVQKRFYTIVSGTNVHCACNVCLISSDISLDLRNIMSVCL